MMESLNVVSSLVHRASAAGEKIENPDAFPRFEVSESDSVTAGTCGHFACDYCYDAIASTSSHCARSCAGEAFLTCDSGLAVSAMCARRRAPGQRAPLPCLCCLVTWVAVLYLDVGLCKEAGRTCTAGEPASESSGVKSSGKPAQASSGATGPGNNTSSGSRHGNLGSGGSGDEPPRRGSHTQSRSCGAGTGYVRLDDGSDDVDLDDISVSDGEMEDVVADMEMEEAAEAVLSSAAAGSDGDDDDILDSVDVDDIADEILDGGSRGNLSSVMPALVAGSIAPKANIRFRSAVAAVKPASSALRVSATVAPQSDGLDAVLGMREAARVRAVLQRDAERLAREPRRRPLSRGYRQSRNPVEPLTPASAGSLGADAIREGLKGRVAPAQLQAVADFVRTQRMGALLMREIEVGIRNRLAADRDFDVAKFPNAAARFA